MAAYIPMREPCHYETVPSVRPSGMKHRLFVWLAAALVLLASSAPQFALENPRPTEYDVEAAYLFNFGKFVTSAKRVTSAQAPFAICVLGEDPFGPTLDKTTAGETISGRAVVDKRISRAQDAVGCSILYISDSEAERLGRILTTVKDAPVLTVSNLPGFLERGGMIQFVLENGRVRFQVNLSATQQSGLMLSSELLKVAIKVTRGGTQEAQ